MAIKVINNWKLVPTSENTISIMGVFEGKNIQTSPITAAREKEVRTVNSTYVLGSKNSGVWEVQLRHQRPNQTKTLKDLGVL
jgi:hypothetical protein